MNLISIELLYERGQFLLLNCAEFTPLMITNIRNQHSSMNVRMVFSPSLSLSLFIYNYMIYNYVIYGINIEKL